MSGPSAAPWRSGLRRGGAAPPSYGRQPRCHQVPLCRLTHSNSCRYNQSLKLTTLVSVWVPPASEGCQEAGELPLMNDSFGRDEVHPDVSFMVAQLDRQVYGTEFATA